jgi:dCTP diphosphatase
MTASEIEDMKKRLSEFIKERDWEKFHNPKDIAIALSVESNELLELFQWKQLDELPKLMEEKRQEIGSEIADILTFLIAFSNATGIDLYEEFNKKLEYNKTRYPKELVKGKSHKYTYYQKNSSSIPRTNH